MTNSGVLPEGWRIVTFGEIARNVSEYVTKPLENGMDRCVGLDHIEPGSLHIKRWDLISNETSFTRKFKKGQVLFGKRRAYQRKVAIAEFDGICSSDILVLEANKEKIIPELLPFIVQDDRFFDFAIGTSAGSLSPRTKWQSLSTYKVPLPPYEEQRRISSLLWAAEECIIKNELLIEEAERAKLVLMRELFSEGIGHQKFQEIKWIGKIPIEWNIVKIKKIANVIRGASPRPKGDPRYYNGSVSRLMTEDVTRDGMWVNAKIDTLTEEGAKLSRFLEKGSLVLICSGGKRTVGLPGLLANDACIHDGFLALQKIDEKVTSAIFLYYWFLNHQKTMEQLATHGCAFINLTTEILNDTTIALPPLSEQRQITAILTQCDDTIVAAHGNIATSKALKMKLINHFFSGDGN